MRVFYGLILAIVLQGINPGHAQSVHQKDSLTILKLRARLNDWPNLSRFSEENKQLELTSENNREVNFIGNSITAGWRKFWDACFPGKPFLNRGIGGQTSPQMLVRFRADVINLRPKVVVILAGANDIAGNTGESTLGMIENNIASMADLAQANGIKVVLCSLLPALDFPWKKGLEPADKISQLNNWIKNYAVKMGYPYVDYYSPMVNSAKGLKSEYTFDGVHPNKEGYAIMTPLIKQAIEGILNSNN